MNRGLYISMLTLNSQKLYDIADYLNYKENKKELTYLY